MIPNDVDPSLCTGEPLLESLDDGFSPPPRDADGAAAPTAEPGQPPELSLGTQSPF
ncbi:hypothetical protein [Ramlibacter sp. AN1133]|uniref:hypothetical protein n=1 Tax=Ramlibacter sp. AN1133 TaxID=3133429 RepID=UPI0030BE77C3